MSQKNPWEQYFKLTKDRPPSPLLVKALGFVEIKKKALDLGASALNDTRYLISEGFHVVAVDKESVEKK